MIRTTEVSGLDKIISNMEQKIERLSRRVMKTAHRADSMYHNQRHYLRHRAPKVLKRQKLLEKRAMRLVSRLEEVARKNIQIRHSAGYDKGRQNILFMCTHNEAKKLRAMLNVDFRAFNTNKLRPLTRLDYSRKRSAPANATR